LIDKSASYSQEDAANQKADNASRISLNDFTFIKVLGKGSFGKVKTTLKIINHMVFFWGL
jgi:ribosomal protein L15